MVEPIGPAQLIPARRLLSEGLGALRTKVQEKFLNINIIPLAKAQIDLATGPILTDEMAQLISTALNHFEYGDSEDNDPYFTPDQWEKLNLEYKGEYKQLYRSYIDEDDPDVRARLISKYETLSHRECKCVAHVAASQSEQKSKWICKLVDIPEPVTDDWGHKLALALLPMIFEACLPGTPHNVNFILQLPSGKSLHLQGWPDFSITQQYTPWAVKRLRASRSSRLKGVGKIQSPPGINDESKTLAIAQGGIYGIGQMVGSSSDKVPVVLLFKDKSAQVFIARKRAPTGGLLEHSLGEVHYEYVERADSMSLKDANELKLFSRIMASVFRPLNVV